MLQDNPDNYRLTPFYDKLRPIFGGGLFTSEGEAWSWRRHLVQPAFKPSQVKARVPTISAVATRLLERWEGRRRAALRRRRRRGRRADA